MLDIKLDARPFVLSLKIVGARQSCRNSIIGSLFRNFLLRAIPCDDYSSTTELNDMTEN